MTNELKEDIKRITHRTFGLWRDYFKNNGDKSQGEILSLINNSIEVAITASEHVTKAETSENNCNIADVSVSFTANDVDGAYLLGVFNVSGIDGLQKEISRIKELGLNPSVFLTILKNER